MNVALIFVWIIAIEEFLASLFYFFGHDWKRGTLWLCYAVCAVLVTYL